MSIPPLLLEVANLRIERKGQSLLTCPSLQIFTASCTTIVVPADGGRDAFCHFLATGTIQPGAGVRITGERIFSCEGEAVEVPQNYHRYVTEMRVSDQLLFRAENRNLPREQAKRNSLWACDLVGLAGFLTRNPLTLSGGEMKKLGFAAALSGRPLLVVLDEPLSEIDSASRSNVIDLLSRELPGAGIATCVLTSRAPPKLLDQARAYGLSLERELVPFDSSKPASRWHPGIRPHAIGRARSCQVELGRVVFALSDLTFTYAGASAPALRAISAELRLGQWIALRGPNGAGKSTLLALLLGFERTKARGALSYEGAPLVKGVLKSLRKRCGVLFQADHHHFFGSTVSEELAMGFACRAQEAHPAYPAENPTDVARRFGLESQLDEIVDDISAQSRRLLGLATALLLMDDVLILDEPTAGLDSEGREVALRELARVKPRGALVLVITHDTQFADTICSYVIELVGGEVRRYERLEAAEESS